MFGVITSGAGSYIDPDEERSPPPPPTVVYFPQNDLDVHSFHTDEEWTKHMPNLFEKYVGITKPNDITLDHLQALNVSVDADVDLDQIVPAATGGHEYLPPQANHNPHSRRSSTKGSSPNVNGGGQKYPLLSNGHKAPDLDTYFKYANELTCENEDAFRVIARRKARAGHQAPHISNFRRFWGGLEVVASYWDSTEDHYYEAGESSERPQKPARGLKRLSVALNALTHPESSLPSHGQRYKGRRISTGSKMPEHFRIDMIRAFMEPLAWAFGCILMNPKRTPQMEISRLRLPVTQTAVVWRNSQDKAQSKRGITEGPLLGAQCRGETGFMIDSHAAALDAAREIAGLLLIAEERAREGKTAHVPGEGEWYTTKPRWGGGPGGDFGDKEENTDQGPPPVKHGAKGISSATDRRHVAGPTIRYIPRAGGGNSEEQIWKQLKPGPTLWDPRHAYVAVGKDRTRAYDNVYMISSLYHHMAILKLTVHPLYIDFLVSGKAPLDTPPGVKWYQPVIERSRWYDLLVPEQRGEAFRGLWAVMSYLMRSGDNVQSHQELGRRQRSDSHQHHFSLRKKASEMTPAESAPRSNSLA